jgi:hypothetical protein
MSSQVHRPLLFLACDILLSLWSFVLFVEIGLLNLMSIDAIFIFFFGYVYYYHTKFFLQEDLGFSLNFLIKSSILLKT